VRDATITGSRQAERDPPRSLVERARKGDPDAFTDMVRHYDDDLRGLAYRILGDRDRMDDALQEAYLKAFRALPRFRGRSSLGTWLYRIVYNACLDELARSRRHAGAALEDVAEPADRRAGVADTAADRGDLARALASLTPQDRAAVLLVDAHGLDYREAAEVLDVPHGTVASRLHRARAALRRALAAEGQYG
jgi:RNA polymerase sigma-70 factor (ECF subfamily)